VELIFDTGERELFISGLPDEYWDTLLLPHTSPVLKEKKKRLVIYISQSTNFVVVVVLMMVSYKNYYNQYFLEWNLEMRFNFPFEIIILPWDVRVIGF
jgi:hypothetical protein